MSNVYFKPVGPKASEEEISRAARAVLETLVEREKWELAAHIPLKVHFGEKGNHTYLKPEVYNGIIDFLESRGIRSEFIETSVLYGGERAFREKHLKLAAAHGFNRLPVVIADGARGEESVSVPVNLKHFQKCAVSKALAEAEQVLVLAHFKGHALAGFGGAIKQLSMGFAAKGGKLAMHMSVKPRIRHWKCRNCGLCFTRCQEKAISRPDGGKPQIDPEKCVGCGGCFSICPHHAVSIVTWAGIRNTLFRKRNFQEKLVEYAFAAHHGKRHIYLNFAVNITAGCDCEPRPMFRCASDIGVFASTDPVAIDSACLKAVADAGKKFKGAAQLDYAESISLGSRNVHLIRAD